MDGVVSVIGFLGSSDTPQPGLLDALSHICTVRGVYVGSRAMLQEMIRAIEANDLHPIIDQRIFSLEQAVEAYQHMVSCSQRRQGAGFR